MNLTAKNQKSCEVFYHSMAQLVVNSVTAYVKSSFFYVCVHHINDIDETIYVAGLTFCNF